MKQPRAAVLALLLVVAVLPSLAAPPVTVEMHETPPVTTFLKQLKVGQAVALEEKQGRYQLGLFPETIRPLSHTVIEIGQDFVALRDVANVRETIIPVYSILSIQVLRVEGKQPG